MRMTMIPSKSIENVHLYAWHHWFHQPIWLYKLVALRTPSPNVVVVGRFAYLLCSSRNDINSNSNSNNSNSNNKEWSNRPRSNNNWLVEQLMEGNNVVHCGPNGTCMSITTTSQQIINQRSLVRLSSMFISLVIYLLLVFSSTNAKKVSGLNPRLSQTTGQIDLIRELNVQHTIRSGLLLDHNKNILYLNGDFRDIRLSDEACQKAAEVISNTNEITFLITLKQVRRNTGVIFAFVNGIHRILEIQSSGRRKELRFHYRVEDTVFSESFEVDLADDNWHKIALTISDIQLDLHIDCVHRFRRSIQRLDKNTFQNNNLTLWLGQRGLQHFIYKGYLKEVRIISSSNGFRAQCPMDLGTACPTCGQFKELKDSINELEDTVKHLSEKLHLMEQRLSNVESCECSKSCHVNGTRFKDGSSWKDNCHHCSCSTGEVTCQKVDCEDSSSIKNLSLSLLNNANKPRSKSKRCLYNKKLYNEGESFERWTNKNQVNRKCYECICKSRSMRCKEKICPELNCPVEKRIQPDDRCCMICETDFCSLGHDCHPNAECRNLATNYTCHCKAGFIGNGHTCEDIDECLNENNHKCINGVCVNKPGSYECRCKSGFKPTPSNQYHCTDIDECSNGEHKCSEHAICTNLPGTYQCQCKNGYDGDGHVCKPVCKDSCLNGGQCKEPNTCSCRKGYYGHRCEEDIDECSLGIHQCPKNSKCINKPGWYRCQCEEGYEDKRELLDGNTFDLECQDINECANPSLNTCPSNSKCVNFDGGYRCECNTTGNQLLTDYSICPQTCIVDGIERKDGDLWSASLNEPCTICQCRRGVVTCEPKKCDCSQDNNNNNIDLFCCSECHQKDKVCYHQENHNVYKNGQRWTYECETCECMNGEIDCWNECPQINCLNAIRMPGDCCLRCEDDPCQSSVSLETSNNDNNNIFNYSLAGCRHQDRQYKSGQAVELEKDKCASCLCQNGRLCCSYTFPCVDESNHLPVSSTVTDVHQYNGKYLHLITPEFPYNGLKPFIKQFSRQQQHAQSDEFVAHVNDLSIDLDEDSDDANENNNDEDNDNIAEMQHNVDDANMENSKQFHRAMPTNAIDDADWSHEMASN